MVSGKCRLQRDMAEYFKSLKSVSTTTTSTCHTPSYYNGQAWVGKRNKTIFFYHWSCLNKGYDSLHSIEEFKDLMKGYNIVVEDFIEQGIEQMPSQFIYTTCMPNKKKLVFRTTYGDLKRFLETYKNA